jgi:hypothetical protein
MGSWGWAKKLAAFGNRFAGRAGAVTDAGKRALKSSREAVGRVQQSNPSAQIISSHLGLSQAPRGGSSFLDRASTYNNTSKYGGAIQPEYDSDDGEPPPVPQFRFTGARGRR